MRISRVHVSIVVFKLNPTMVSCQLSPDYYGLNYKRTTTANYSRVIVCGEFCFYFPFRTRERAHESNMQWEPVYWLTLSGCLHVGASRKHLLSIYLFWLSPSLSCSLGFISPLHGEQVSFKWM